MPFRRLLLASRPPGPHTGAWLLRPVLPRNVLRGVEDEPEPLVTINAIGVKVRERVRLGGELCEL